MCRFLMVKSRAAVAAEPWLAKFAAMAEASRAPDGDRQADGWGAGWLNESGKWLVKKSVAPVWAETVEFKDIPETRMLLLHARSASFPAHKNILDFNQPFDHGRFGFVFNGLLRGVSLPEVPGAIGAQKIWSLLLGFLKQDEPGAAMGRLVALLEKKVREIAALNVGLSDGERLYAYCRYAGHPGYYQLRVSESAGLTAVCSEPLDGLGFRPIPPGEIAVF